MSVLDRLAFEIFSAEWSKEAMVTALDRAFKQNHAWLEGLVDRLMRQWPTRPTFPDLRRFVGCDLVFRRACKTDNLTLHSFRGRSPGAGSIASCSWNLPSIDSIADLSSWLGIPTRRLTWLSAAHRDGLAHGDHYVCTWIRKRSTGIRLVESPKPQLKSVQRQILDEILSRIPTHDACHGFKRGRNVMSFAAPHIGRQMCLKMDLKDFFPGIHVQRVAGLFRSVGYPRNVGYLLACLVTTCTLPRAMDAAIPSKRSLGASELSRLYLPRHLPQGAPTSPTLANLIAYRLDCRLSGLASRSGVSYSRYADDLLFSGDAIFARTAKRFQIIVGGIALEEGHEVNFRKSRFMRQSQRQFATGIILNACPNVRRQSYERLKAILNNCVRMGPDSQNREQISDFRLHLLGKIQWFAQVNSEKAKRLRAKFDQIAW